ncbi:MAG: ABC transporter permease [Opitutales bacterium]|nr:ABC transporter permease [Opitutales bacterium]
MEFFNRIKNSILNLFQKKVLEEETKEEMRLHIEHLQERYQSQGMSKSEARKAALRDFGNAEKLKEDCRDSWGTRVISDLIRDVRYSFRSLRKNKGVSGVVILTLAVCIGVNATFLSALYSLVLKPLPVKEPENLVQLFNSGNRSGSRTTSDGYSHSSWNQYNEFKERSDLFDGCALRYAVTELMTVNGSIRRTRGQKVSGDFFNLMGARPLLGRFFSPDECNPTNPEKVIVLTQTAWENHYSANPKILGTQIRIDDFTDGGVHYTVIGVAERTIEVFDAKALYFTPFRFFNRDIGNPAKARYLFNMDLWIRLKPDVSRETALDQIRSMDRRWYEEIADEEGRRGYERYGLHEFDKPHSLERYLYLLEAGSLLLLLVGCFNVMNLNLNRVSQKGYELFIRSALGASKQTTRRLWFVESFSLIAIALGLGILLAMVSVEVLNHYLNTLSPSTIPINLDKRIVAGSLIFTLLLAAVMGLLPLQIFWRTGSIQRDDRVQRTVSSKLSQRLSSGMIIGQVAVAFTMLICAVMLFRSFQKVMAVDPGFSSKQVVQGRLDWSAIGPFYKKRSEASDLKQRIHSTMKDIPGVENVAFIMSGMFSGDLRRGPIAFFVRGEPPNESFLRHGNAVSPEFFTTMNIPIIEGRNFNAGDTGRAVIVDELFVSRFFPDRSPIGLEISNQILPDGEPWPRIVGVSRRANIRGLEERDDGAIIYINRPVNVGDWEYTILLRSSRSATGVIRDMQSALSEIDPRLALVYVGTLDEAIDEMLVGRRSITLLMGVFSLLTLLLSLLGIYAVIAYDVSLRRREIGIRSAIGASKSTIFKMVLNQGLSKTVVGLTVGILVSLYLSRFLEQQLFDISTIDPGIYFVALIVFISVALIASFLPAQRALRFDPIEALRAE